MQLVELNHIGNIVRFLAIIVSPNKVEIVKTAVEFLRLRMRETSHQNEIDVRSSTLKTKIVICRNQLEAGFSRASLRHFPQETGMSVKGGVSIHKPTLLDNH